VSEAHELFSRIPRARVRLPPDLFPVDPWRIRITRFAARFLPQGVTVFALGSGYLGLRGDPEEGAPVAQPGVFLNGFYESWPIPYGEAAYGFARTGQTIVNVTDGKLMKLYVDDEPFELMRADIRSYTRTLEFRTGSVDREIVWETPAGKRIAMRSSRMVSITHRHLALLSCEITCLDATAHLTLSSELTTRRLDGQAGVDDPRRGGGFDGRVLRPMRQEASGRRVLLSHSTRESGLRMACGMDHVLEINGRVEEWSDCTENRGEAITTARCPSVPACQPRGRVCASGCATAAGACASTSTAHAPSTPSLTARTSPCNTRRRTST